MGFTVKTAMRRFKVSIVALAWLLTFGMSNQSHADLMIYTFTPDSSISFPFLPSTEIVGSFTIDTSGSQPTLVSASITFPFAGLDPLNGTFQAGSVLASDEIQLARFIDGRFDQTFLTLEFNSDFGAPMLGLSSLRLTDPNVLSGQLPLDVTGGGPAIAAVPESSTWAMMLLGFAGVGAMTYRRRKHTAALSVA
jgi:hypothetical protein